MKKVCTKKFHHTKENYKKCGTKHSPTAYIDWEMKRLKKGKRNEKNT